MSKNSKELTVTEMRLVLDGVEKSNAEAGNETIIFKVFIDLDENKLNILKSYAENFNALSDSPCYMMFKRFYFNILKNLENKFHFEDILNKIPNETVVQIMNKILKRTINENIKSIYNQNDSIKVKEYIEYMKNGGYLNIHNNRFSDEFILKAEKLLNADILKEMGKYYFNKSYENMISKDNIIDLKQYKIEVQKDFFITATPMETIDKLYNN